LVVKKPAVCCEMLVVSTAPVSFRRPDPTTLMPPGAERRRVRRLVAVTRTSSIAAVSCTTATTLAAAGGDAGRGGPVTRTVEPSRISNWHAPAVSLPRAWRRVMAPDRAGPLPAQAWAPPNVIRACTPRSIRASDRALDAM
jgi:hypothetical protein